MLCLACFPRNLGRSRHSDGAPHTVLPGAWLGLSSSCRFCLLLTRCLPLASLGVCCSCSWILILTSPFPADLNWCWGKGHINNKSINFCETRIVRFSATRHCFVLLVWFMNYMLIFFIFNYLQMSPVLQGTSHLLTNWVFFLRTGYSL